MSDGRCFVCDKQRGLVDVPGGCLYEDELVYASHGIIDPVKKRSYIGTLFVEPKRHVSGVAELTDPEAERIGRVVTRLARALKQTADIEHVYVHVLGHHIDHLHVWLVARYRGTPREFWPMRLADWPNAPKGDAMVIGEFCERLRSYL